MPSKFTANLSLVDKSNAVSVVQLYVIQADASAYVTNPVGNPITTLVDAIKAVSLDAKTQVSVGREELFTPVTVPTDDQAYNSSKLIVYFQDSVTADKYTLTIPARDASKYNTYPNSKDVILTVAAGGTLEIETLVTELQAKARTKNGNAFTVSKIQIAGRRQGG